MLRRIFGPKPEKITGVWKILIIPSLDPTFRLDDQIKTIKLEGIITRMKQIRFLRNISWNVQSKSLLRSPCHRWRIILKRILNKFGGKLRFTLV
jgi:hypothetical protein